MNEIGRRRADRVLQQFRENPDGHDQFVFFRPAPSSGQAVNLVQLTAGDDVQDALSVWDCGTACCFAGQVAINLGAQPVLTPRTYDDSAELETDRVLYHGQVYAADVFAVAALDIAISDGGWLFSGDNDLHDLARIVGVLGGGERPGDHIHTWQDCALAGHWLCMRVRLAAEAIAAHDPETV